jgi:hypothetical protein
MRIEMIISIAIGVFFIVYATLQVTNAAILPGLITGILIIATFWKALSTRQENENINPV